MLRKAAHVAFGVAMASSLMIVGANAEGDAVKGAKVFNKCKSCHTIEDGGAKKIGPNLHGVFGRTAGSVEGFKYSKGMTGSGIVWSEETLAEFLANPRAYVKGTKMTFAGVKNESQLEDLMEYLEHASGAE